MSICSKFNLFFPSISFNLLSISFDTFLEFIIGGAKALLPSVFSASTIGADAFNPSLPLDFLLSFGSDYFNRILKFNEIQKIKLLYNNLQYSFVIG